MSNQKLLKWLEWRYPDVWVDFKKFANYHALYNKSSNIQEQSEHVIKNILVDYIESFDLVYANMDMNKRTKRLFSHINILLMKL